MSFGFEDPTIDRVTEVTAEYGAGSYGNPPWVTLTFKGQHSPYRRTEECTLHIVFAGRSHADFAERLATAINALTELPEEEEV